MKDKDSLDIMLIQSAYARKDADMLKQLFNKPKTFKDSTILGYGRLANQYVNDLQNPSKQLIKRAKSKFGIDLQSSGNPKFDLRDNVKEFFKKFGKKSRGGKPLPTPTPPTPTPTRPPKYEKIFPITIPSRDVPIAEKFIYRIMHSGVGFYTHKGIDYYYYRVLYKWSTNKGMQYTSLPRTPIGQYPRDVFGQIIRDWQKHVRGGVMANKNFKYKGIKQTLLVYELVEIRVVFSV